MADLTNAAKVRLVTLLAQFSTASDAARIVSDEFGVTLTRAQAWKYDATRSGCNTSPRLRLLFAEIRERWLNDLSSIPIAHQGHRLRALNRLASKMELAGDHAGAMKALEQAARETGGLLTNERRATLNATVRTVPIDPAEARAELAARLEGFLDQLPLAAPGSNAALPAA